MIRKALIFAAGKGTRLRPITDHTPKALVKVGGEPMLKRVILKLKEAGVREMVVNVHHLAGQVEDYIEANHQFGIDIHISDESDLLLDTGGGILKAAKWLEDGTEPFIVHNADILTDFDLKAMQLDHTSHHRDVTLLCDQRDTSRYLLFDKEKRMHGWCNVTTGAVRPASLTDAAAYTKLAFGGVHIMQPSVIGNLKEYSRARAERTGAKQSAMPFSIMDFFIDYCGRIEIGAHRPEGSYLWHDIGKPESLERAEDIFRSKGGR